MQSTRNNQAKDVHNNLSPGRPAPYGTGSTQSLIGNKHPIGYIEEDVHSEDEEDSYGDDDDDDTTERGPDPMFFGMGSE